jgi:NAD(P)H dehydrogenase (quinone)
MKVYVVYCHPDPNSFTAVVLQRAVDTLGEAGHQVRVSDLYADQFQPTVSLHEISMSPGPDDQLDLASYCDNLQWCDTLVFIYPTWWSGQPAMLTGWFDRVLVRRGARRLTDDATTVTSPFTNIRRVVAITSHGSSKFLNVLEGESGRRVIGRAVRPSFHRFARSRWVAMYNIDRSTDADRTAFLDRVERRMRRV